MMAKDYLEQVKSKEARIRNLRRDKESIKDMLYSLGGAGTGERVQASRTIDKFGTLYSQIDEMERQIDSEIASLMMFKMKVSDEINHMKTDRYMTVLNCRYIHFQSWEKIAEDAFPEQYTVRYILKLHGLALLEFGEIYKKMLGNMDKKCQESSLKDTK